MDILTLSSAVLIGCGTLFLWIAAVGIVRFPDFYSRLHAAGIGDTLGALLITLGIMLKTGLTLLSVKVFIVFIIYLITNPLGTNLIILEAVHAKDYQGYTRKVLRKKESNSGKEKGAEIHADA